MSDPIITLAQQLIRCPSVSPNDAGCQDIIIPRLIAKGFTVEPMNFGDTRNVWAWRGEGKTLAFAGHTDVVPSGDERLWRYPPFTPTRCGDELYGRGAADMKGALAAMVIAAERFVEANPTHRGRLAFLITSDEEGKAVNGTVKVVAELKARHERLDYCVVGEPSSTQRLGDVVKNGRRGSLTAHLRIHGVQGHVAYPHLAENPLHRAIPALQALVATTWDEGNASFPPTALQITHLQAGSGGDNVIPGECDVQFNFRFSTELTEAIIKQRVEALLQEHLPHYSIEWTLSGQPFLTDSGELVEAVENAVKQAAQLTPQLLTTGGTSDGRFIAPMGTQVVELGPVNATIHKIDERVSIADLRLLSDMYQHIMEQLIA